MGENLSLGVLLGGQVWVVPFVLGITIGQAELGIVGSKVKD